MIASAQLARIGLPGPLPPEVGYGAREPSCPSRFAEQIIVDAVYEGHLRQASAAVDGELKRDRIEIDISVGDNRVSIPSRNGAPAFQIVQLNFFPGIRIVVWGGFTLEQALEFARHPDVNITVRLVVPIQEVDRRAATFREDVVGD